MTLMSTLTTADIAAELHAPVGEEMLIGKTAILCGWVHRRRDHGGLAFLDLRDFDGIIQCRADKDVPFLAEFIAVRPESVVKITGTVVKRPAGTENPKLATGSVEINVTGFEVLNPADILPFEITDDGGEFTVNENLRLAYRFLDLRRERMRQNLKLRSEVIWAMREHMRNAGFMEITTPILTASSPEGARDYLVPSRLHPGKFYALPQAPQIFKQLLMCSGVERYFQIAPCFRDEASRSDRLAGEFYQLDLEMAFARQEDVFAVVGTVLHAVFSSFAAGVPAPSEWPRIPYREAMLKYGSDKPDLRYDGEIADITDIIAQNPPPFLAEVLAAGGVVRAIAAFIQPETAWSNKSWKDLESYARDLGMPGLGYVRTDWDSPATMTGPMSKFLDEGQMKAIMERFPHDGVVTEADPAYVFIAGPEADVVKWAGPLRVEIAKRTGWFLDEFRFCWITDFPMYELDEAGKVAFSHNPFSMPQGWEEKGMAVFDQDPLTILAHQYDIVCNGVELCSGAVRNHKVDMLYRAFEIAGYDAATVDAQFPALIKAFRYGAPPHAGCAPGVERIIMLLAGEDNVRAVVPFPLNAQAQDPLMNAPNEVTPEQLRELSIRVVTPK